MKKYLLGFLAIALAIAITAFVKRSETTLPKKKHTPAVKKEEPNVCVWLQFTGNAGDDSSARRCDNWVEYSGNPMTLCNNVNQKNCAICVKSTALQGTAPNRFLIGVPGHTTTAKIFFNKYVAGNTWYVVLGPGSDAEQVRNRN